MLLCWHLFLHEDVVLCFAQSMQAASAPPRCRAMPWWKLQEVILIESLPRIVVQEVLTNLESFCSASPVYREVECRNKPCWGPLGWEYFFSGYIVQAWRPAGIQLTQVPICPYGLYWLIFVQRWFPTCGFTACISCRTSSQDFLETWDVPHKYIVCSAPNGPAERFLRTTIFFFWSDCAGGVEDGADSGFWSITDISLRYRALL